MILIITSFVMNVMMYRIGLILVISIFSNSIFSQVIQVLDSYGNPISNVFVFNQTHQGLTNDDGKIVFPVFEQVEISFQHLGYSTITYSIIQIQDMEFTVRLDHKCNQLETVELIGRCQKKNEVFQQIENIHMDQLLINQAQSTPELLERKSGVFMQKTQMGGGSPVVRGFEANKVLLVQDGVRLNNAIYRSGHLHNILGIDDRALEKIDLIYGPGALNYGSDAIGGVLHFVSKNPQFNTRKLNYYSSFASANNGLKNYIDFNLSSKKLASITSLGYGNYGNLRTGNNRTQAFPDFGKREEYVINENGIDRVVENENPNIQVGTAYQQWNISNKTKYLFNEKLSITSNIQYSSSSDIPRYDFLTERKNGKLKYAEWKYGPQERLFIAETIDAYFKTKMYDKLKTILSYQKLREERIKRKFQKARLSQLENLEVWAATMDFYKTFGAHQKIGYGIDLQYNDLVSTAEEFDLNELVSHNNTLTRYPNGKNSMLSSGIYANYYIQDVVKSLDLSAGLRYQQTNVNLQYVENDIIDWPQSNYKGIKNKNNALTGSVSLKYEPASTISMNWISATAFRAPNIDDIAKIRVKKGDILMPNTDLKPEKSLSHELNLTWRPFSNKNNYINIAIYHTDLKDAIIRDNFKFNKVSKYISFDDTLNVIANQNIARAKVDGISLSTQVQLMNLIKIEASFTKIKGTESIQNNNTIEPLAHIPPAYGKMGVSYHKNKVSAQLSYNFYDHKKLEEYGGSSDNLENATTDGTPAYHLFNIETKYEFNKSIVLSVGLRNIFDTHYRLFSSGVSGAGRNLIISISGQI